VKKLGKKENATINGLSVAPKMQWHWSEFYRTHCSSQIFGLFACKLVVVLFDSSGVGC